MTPQARTPRDIVASLITSPEYRELVALAQARYQESLEAFVQTSPASELLRGRVLEARHFVELLSGMS
jgi:hypothetical protein